MEEDDTILEEKISGAIHTVLPRLTDRDDLSSASRVCAEWFEADRTTRERVTIPLCYAVCPGRVSGRFPYLKSLRLKGRPRAEMFALVPEFWGGYATPWVNEIAISRFSAVKSIRFKRIIISDLDLDVLARALANKLEALELKWCYGFTADGLMSITKRCRKIESLIIAWCCLFEEKSGDWLHEVALHNTSLKVLHCHETNFSKVNLQDLETIAEKCCSLASLKISGFDLVRLEGTLMSAKVLEEFYGGCIIVDPDNPEDDDKYLNVDKKFPPKLCRLGDIVDLHVDEISLLYGVAARIQELDLYHSVLDPSAHCLLLERMPKLEVLRTTNCIGDQGLIALSRFCKNLKELIICLTTYEEDEGRFPVTDKGVISVAENCKELESVSVCVNEISNSSLIACAENLRELRIFGLQLISMTTTEGTLDDGVRALLRACEKLRKISLHLYPGVLSDVGMAYIGNFGSNLKRIKLVFAGDSDIGLEALARGCKKLQKLELLYCSFSERGLATAVSHLSSLRYIHAQAYKETERSDLSVMSRPEWRIELCPTTAEEICHLVAYASLGFQLSDYPEIVLRFN